MDWMCMGGGADVCVYGSGFVDVFEEYVLHMHTKCTHVLTGVCLPACVLMDASVCVCACVCLWWVVCIGGFVCVSWICVFVCMVYWCICMFMCLCVWCTGVFVCLCVCVYVG